MGGMSPRSEPLLALTIDLNARPIQQRVIDDHLGQSGCAGRRGRYGDRWRSTCTAFNIVKARHTATQGKWQRDQEGECNFPKQCQTGAADAVYYICSASPSDQLHAGQINGFHPTLRGLKKQEQMGGGGGLYSLFSVESFRTSAEVHEVTSSRKHLTLSSIAVNVLFIQTVLSAGLQGPVFPLSSLLSPSFSCCTSSKNLFMDKNKQLLIKSSACPRVHITEMCLKTLF